jgi:hypothetical protein
MLGVAAAVCNVQLRQQHQSKHHPDPTARTTTQEKQQHVTYND